ncbi:MAG: pyridoxal-phosphate dependent enzyme [Thermoplasmataceae archaeon]
MEQVLEEEKPPGMTPFFRARNIENHLDLKKVFFKFEGASITGTQKDRISRLHIRRAKEQGYDTVAVGTCGNYGASVSYFAALEGMKSVIATPSFYSGARNQEIYENGAVVMELDLKYEELLDYMKDKTRDENWYDCSPGSSNSNLDILGYESIAIEIYNQLGHCPSYLAVPVGNGTTISGIFSGFKKLYRKGLTSSLPKLIASSTSLGNPVVHSWRRNLRRIQDLDPLSITETHVNEPLVSYRPTDGQKALSAIIESRGVAQAVTDEEMLGFSRMIEKLEYIQVMPASSSAMAAANHILSKKQQDHDVVVVLTGRGDLWTTR